LSEAIFSRALDGARAIAQNALESEKWWMRLKKFRINRQNAMNNTMLKEKTFYPGHWQAECDRYSKRLPYLGMVVFHELKLGELSGTVIR